MSREHIPFLNNWSGNISLDAAGLVALADIDTVARRTALTGTAHLLDCLILCPGLHRQQCAISLHNGESPPMAAMSTGYTCRVENPAMISYLQKIGVTGELTFVMVEKQRRFESRKIHYVWRVLDAFISCQSLCTNVAYLTAVASTFCVLILFLVASNWWGLGILIALVLARLFNVVIIRRRTCSRWHGAPEPGVRGDNLILLSEDRWVRLQGDLDDIKAVTSGQWLRNANFAERAGTAFATVLVYATAALASNVSQHGKIVILALMLGSAGLLAIANESTESLSMHGRIIKMNKPRLPYTRRLAMISKLIDEVGRDDWAVRMGFIVPQK